ncbi:MAG TPA: hypothetical protein VFR41_14350 [Acidimicrobiia bacterium]|nr:hypothetical protein [Acidimicrobiia bacterium]
MRLMCRLPVVMLAAVLSVPSCSAARAALPDIDALTCPDPVVVDRQSSSVAALPALAAHERQPLSPRDYEADPGMVPARAAERTIATPALVREMRAASAAACSLRTPTAARRAGYVLSSAFTQGVGTHWTNWRLIDQPFDPARPSMLLYANRRGRQSLVGFSYWVRAATAPDGFSGAADHWHRHFGLCFDRSGFLQREAVTKSNTCRGSWLNGSDLWMLHAWIVPGDANPSGVFAVLNPTLCSRTGPDIARCPGFG